MRVPHLIKTTESALSLLKKIDQIKIIYVLLIQVMLGFLDLFGVVLVGALGALAIQGVESQKAGNKVSILLRLLHIQNDSFQQQVSFLGLTAGLILVVKTIASLILTRKIYYFLSYKTSQVSGELIRKIFSQNLVDLQKRTSQQTLYIVTEGTKSLLIGVLAAGINLISDSTLLFIMTLGLFFVDPVLAISTILIFATIGYLLYRLLNVRAHYLGSELNKLSVIGNQKILEALDSYRELIVRNRRQFYSNEIQKNRFSLGEVTAESNFQPYISKYVVEATSVLGALTVGGYEFATKNAVHAVSVLAVFLAASSRIAPSALRIQQGVLAIKNSAGSADSALQLIDELKDFQDDLTPEFENHFIYSGFIPEIKISSLSFRYQANHSLALDNINLTIKQGSSVAFVGPSGAGKTTLVDIILGVLEPTTGAITISGVSPRAASKRWGGAISYVPQNIVVISGTIRENVGLGYGLEKFDDELILKALRIAQLEETVFQFPKNIDSDTGENGSKLSGGERQRLGIARALFTKPKLIVLDEATSSLDGKTEADITKSLELFAGEVTTLIVAHRLSTIRNVDQVVYLENGKIQAVGKFEEIRQKIPNFETQANLMGL